MMRLKPEQENSDRASAAIVRSRSQQRLSRHYLGLLLLEVVIACVTSALVMLLKGSVAGFSALLGGVIFLLPVGWFSLRVLVRNGRNTPREVVSNMYVGVMGKLGLTAVLFSMVFVLIKPLEPLYLLGAYILLQMTWWYLQLRLDARFLKL
jgi:ATP synthase protein I